MMRKYFFCSMLCIPLLSAAQSLQVLSVFPPPNDNTASGNTEIRIDFNLPIDTSGIEQQFVVMGSMNGLYPAGVSVEPSLQSVVLQPAMPFVIGERVKVTARSTLVGNGGESFNGFNWQFTIKPTLPTPPYFSELRVFNVFSGGFYTTMFPADVNNDHYLDLVIVGSPMQIGINDGLGNFSLSQQLPNPFESPDIPITDVDLDGFKEIVTNTGIYEADANGSFHLVQSFTFTDAVYDVADMNGDGYPDLIMGGGIGISYNNGSGQFGAVDTILTDTTTIVDAVAGDFNNDGINDIAYATQAFATPGGTAGHHSLRIAYLSSAGDTLNRDIYNSEDFPNQSLFFPEQVSILDFNQDNFLDIFIGSMENFIVLNDPQDGFAIDSALQVGGGGEGYSRTDFRDITADGWLDQLFIKQSFLLDGGVSVYNINVEGSFPSFLELLEERQNALPFVSTAGDFNGDGSQDVATLWNDGLRLHFNHVQVSIPPGQDNIPEQFILHQNYPNPFNGETLAPFYLPKGGNVESVIYDISGKEVKRFPTAFYPAGEGRLKWDARNNNGKEVSSGVYVWKFIFQGAEQSIKVILAR